MFCDNTKITFSLETFVSLFSQNKVTEISPTRMLMAEDVNDQVSELVGLSALIKFAELQI